MKWWPISRKIRKDQERERHDETEESREHSGRQGESEADGMISDATSTLPQVPHLLGLAGRVELGRVGKVGSMLILDHVTSNHRPSEAKCTRQNDKVANFFPLPPAQIYSFRSTSQHTDIPILLLGGNGVHVSSTPG